MGPAIANATFIDGENEETNVPKANEDWTTKFIIIKQIIKRSISLFKPAIP